MAVNKAKVAVVFIVAGFLTVVFGTVLTFVGPLIIDDQIVKVRTGGGGGGGGGGDRAGAEVEAASVHT